MYIILRDYKLKVVQIQNKKGGVLMSNLFKLNNAKNNFLFYAFVIIVFLIALYFFPADPEQYGVLSLVPAIFLMFYVFYTKRVFEALFVSALLGYVAVYKWGFLTPFNDMLLSTMMSEDIAWLFIVMALMGAIIGLLEKSGGSFAFAEWVIKRIKSRKSSMLWSWALGIFIFIDDYMNALVVGTTMSPVTDRYKVSREFLAYIVDTTAAPVTILLPVSTWAAYIASLLEQNGLAAEGEGMAWFIKSIPFNFYGWIALLIVPLVILGVIPLFGPMKKAEKRAIDTGILAPPGSEKIDIRGGKEVEKHENAKILNFFLPLIFLVISSIYFGGGVMNLDLQLGALTTVVFMFILYLPQGLLGPMEFVEAVIDGMKNMVMPLVLVILAYSFGAAAEEVKFIQYAIALGMKFVTPQLLPFTVFTIFTITEFIMGLSWGMYVVAFPIVLPLANAMGVNPAIVIGAVTSAGVFGSHICFYSDATILTSAACGCDNYRHAITQAPYGLLGATLSAIAFLVVGFFFV